MHLSSQRTSPLSSVSCLAKKSGVSISAESGPSTAMNDTVVDTIIFAVDGNGHVVREVVGAMIEF